MKEDTVEKEHLCHWDLMSPISPPLVAMNISRFWGIFPEIVYADIRILWILNCDSLFILLTCYVHSTYTLYFLLNNVS